MAPAAEVMEEALGHVELHAPVVPLVANVSGIPTRDPRAIRSGLVEQVTAMVRWRESMMFLRSAGVEEVVEIGPGRVLTGLAKRIDAGFSVRSVGTAAEVEGLMKELCVPCH
jgi:[acyl-carrier-protein] S-malonyltransferase